jgi:hypothetical protein
MKIILAGMHRSGTNAIGRWLLRQSALKDVALKPVLGDWVEGCKLFPNGGGTESFSFVSQINHPDHHDFPRFDNEVITIEREDYETSKLWADKYPQHEFILVARDFKNWLASVLQMYNNKHAGEAEVMPDLVQINKDADEFITIRRDVERYATHLSSNKIILSYNKWCTSKKCREELCELYGLKFTDCGFNDVSDNAGGSSFDGVSMNGRGNEMKVLERWKKFKDDPVFNIILEHNQEILKMSNEIFGVYE